MCDAHSQQLHEVYAAAERLDIADEAVKDFLNRDVHDTSPRIAWARAVLMAMSNPNELSQRQLTFVAFLLERFKGFDLADPSNQKHGLDLKAMALREGVSLFMLLIAAFQLLLHRYTGQTDIVVGTAVANRARSDIERVVGFFANNIALRTDLSGNPTVTELLLRLTR